MIDYIPRRFTVIRDKDLCVNCGKCITECSNGCHLYSPKDKKRLSQSRITVLRATGVFQCAPSVRSE